MAPKSIWVIKWVDEYHYLKPKTINSTQFMNIKRIFGAFLTLFGIGGLIYSVILFVNKSGEHNVKALITYGIIGFIFFLSGIGLIRITKDEL